MLRRPWVHLMAKARLITPRHKARAGGAAVRAADVPLGEPHPVVRDGVNLRRRDLLCESLAAQLTPTEIICKNDENVWLGRRCS